MSKISSSEFEIRMISMAPRNKPEQVIKPIYSNQNIEKFNLTRKNLNPNLTIIAADLQFM